MGNFKNQILDVVSKFSNANSALADFIFDVGDELTSEHFEDLMAFLDNYSYLISLLAEIWKGERNEKT